MQPALGFGHSDGRQAGRDGWTAVAFPPPLAPANTFSRSGCGRSFPLLSRVMRVKLSTAPGWRRPASVLLGPTFSGPHDCISLVNFLQAYEFTIFTMPELSTSMPVAPMQGTTNCTLDLRPRWHRRLSAVTNKTLRQARLISAPSCCSAARCLPPTSRR